MNDAGEMAEQLGDLPLALAQAVGFMRENGLPAADYLRLLTTAARQVLASGTSANYPASLSASISLALQRVDEGDIATGQLVRLLARLGPAPVPMWMLMRGGGAMPDALRAAASDAIALQECVRARPGSD